ncbi:MAG: hypothetical protein K6A92_03795 [Lachnospiraceae bacterium]|nr:hypothetical protein [Lachnospiraceae bacterium]
MPVFEQLLEACKSHNGTIARYGTSEETLGEHLEHIKEKVTTNQTYPYHRDREDVIKLASAHAEKLLGKEAAESVKEALSFGVLTTADHHGGLFSAQAFQGDLLYGELLKRMGHTGGYTPLFSFSHVELENSTYARGICCYESGTKRQQLPIQPKKDLNRMVTVTKAFDRSMTERAKLLVQDPETGFSTETAIQVNELLSWFYLDKEVLDKQRYADQITLIGEKLSEEYFTDDPSRRLLYLEVEEILGKLFLKELEDTDSFVGQIFYNPAVREALNNIRTEEGYPLAGLLFRGVDPKGRRVHTQLMPDGSMPGAGLHGFKTSYSTKKEDLKQLVRKRELIPAGFLAAVMLCFERGFTWLGGYFQAIYLTEWRDLFARALIEGGREDLAGTFAKMQCDGYISGPVYLLNPAEDGLCTSGPVELRKYKISAEDFSRRMNITMSDAHKMGLFEIYLDLIPAENKEKDWYAVIASYVKAHYDQYRIG